MSRPTHAEINELIAERIAIGKKLDLSFPRDDFDALHALFTRTYFMTPEEREEFFSDNPTVSAREAFAYMDRTCIWGPAATLKYIGDEVAKPYRLDFRTMRKQLLANMDSCSIAHSPLVTDPKFRKALEKQAEEEQMEVVRRASLSLFQRMLEKLRK